MENIPIHGMPLLVATNCFSLNRGGPLIEQEIGEWTKSGGLIIFEADMWRRRANLHGAVVRKVVQKIYDV